MIQRKKSFHKTEITTPFKKIHYSVYNETWSTDLRTETFLFLLTLGRPFTQNKKAVL